MGGSRLTDAQISPLLVVVGWQEASGEELAFTHCGDEVRASRTVSGKPVDSSQPPWVTRVSPIVFAVWREHGYVTVIESGSVSGSTVRDFVLTQDGLDYARRMRRPRLVRGGLELLATWQSDLRTAVLAMVFTVATNVILNWLGLLR